MMTFVSLTGRLIFIALFPVIFATEDRYYPRYHLAPPYGWMNDPNGFSVFKGEYHLFYQYNPNSSQVPGIAHWGHARSSNLFNWEHLPIAMYPDNQDDFNGVFSGSAIVENEVMYLYYTGHVNHPNQNPDHIERQMLAISKDGVNVQKYEGNPIIRADEHQPNLRDPKVWKHDDTYYMVLGNSFNNNTLGRTLLYTSKDMVTWTEVSVLGESDGFLGFMWECPDLFEIDGQFVLLFSPQGMEPQGDKYRNLFQTGYIVGDFDYNTNIFTPKTKFVELDFGHDFYATQTIKDDFGRRIVVAWFDMWEQDYPERNDGFTGMMTIPRELRLTRSGRLIQRPVSEISEVRGKVLRAGSAGPWTSIVELEDKAGEVLIMSSARRDLTFHIEGRNSAVTISYDSTKGLVTLDRGGKDGVRRTEWKPQGMLNMQVFVDASSIELFCGQGEVTFSSRFFPDGPVQVRLGEGSHAYQFKVVSMKRTAPKTINSSSHVTSALPNILRFLDTSNIITGAQRNGGSFSSSYIMG